MSNASVFVYDSVVLKVENLGFEAENEHKMMLWLQNKLPVPNVIEQVNTNKLSYLLMSRCVGQIACSDRQLAEPKKLCDRLAQTLYQIWSVRTEDCPQDQSLSCKLQKAEFNVLNNLVDTENADPDTFGKNSFKDPEQLLNWLYHNKPPEQPVLSHGDLCLPNIFYHKGKLSGLIDLGRSGTADKWCDIAICYRSLRDNYNGKFGNGKNYGFKESDFFDALQLKPDWEQIRYYLLLDELF